MRQDNLCKRETFVQANSAEFDLDAQILEGGAVSSQKAGDADWRGRR